MEFITLTANQVIVYNSIPLLKSLVLEKVLV